jgi:hypothetical protein
MKTITIKQPYASLIANGYKEYEFRSWKTSYRGELLIHAGISEDKQAMKKFSHLNLDYPKSRVVAKVKLVDCIPIDDKFNKELKALNNEVYGNKDRDGYAWKLELIEKIESDEIIKGKLGLWNLNK